MTWDGVYHSIRRFFKWWQGRSGVDTATFYLKSGATISVDVTDWKWKSQSTELTEYSIIHAVSQNACLRYLRLEDVSAITVTRY